SRSRALRDRGLRGSRSRSRVRARLRSGVRTLPDSLPTNNSHTHDSRLARTSLRSWKLGTASAQDRVNFHGRSADYSPRAPIRAELRAARHVARAVGAPL